MTVFSALFEKIAARIPDADTAKELLAEGVKADPITPTLPERDAERAGMTPKALKTDLLANFVNEVYQLSFALEKMKVPLKLSAEQIMEDVPDDVWDFNVTGAKVQLLQDGKQLMNFKVSATDAGYFVEAEENSGAGGISLAMIQNGPAATMADVEGKLANHLDSSFRIPAAQAAPVLQRLIETVDYRPAVFLEIIKSAPFEKVLDFVTSGMNPAHVYDEYPGKFLPLDWVLMSRHEEIGHKNNAAPFTPEQRRELFEAVAAQAKDNDKIHSDMTLRQASLHNVYDLIPRLIELGARPDASHFVDAGDHDPQGPTLETLKVLRPYAPDVNAKKFDNSAGGNAACRADLDAFKWLESQGLDKTQTAGNNLRSFVHAVVASGRRQRAAAMGAEDGYPAMLHYLIDNGYDFTSKGPAGTPVQMAVENGNLDLAKILIEAGALPDASLMIKLLTPVFYGRGFPMERNVSGAEAVDFMRYLHDEHAVPYTQEVADAPTALLQSAAGYNFFKADFAGLKPLAEVMNFLATQGAVPTETDALKTLRLESAEKLRGIDAETAKTFGIEALPALPRASRLRRTPSP